MGQNAYTQYLKDNTMKNAPSGLFVVLTMEWIEGMHHSAVIFQLPVSMFHLRNITLNVCSKHHQVNDIWSVFCTQTLHYINLQSPTKLSEFYAFIQFKLDVLYALFLSWKIFKLYMFCMLWHPSSGAQLQCTAIGFCGFGVFYSIEQVLVWDSFTVKHGQLGLTDRAKVSKCPSTSTCSIE
jgi:hypothetical protein